MPKPTLILTMLIIGLSYIVMIAVLPAAEDDQPIPEEITIDNEGYKPDRKGPVEFTHIDHTESYEVACNECHHEYVDGENVWEEGDLVEKCSACHNPLKSEGPIKNLRLAFHRKCKNCHKELAKEGISEDAPYRKCKDCH